MDLLFLFGPDDISNVRKIKKGESWNEVFPKHQLRKGKELGFFSKKLVHFQKKTLILHTYLSEICIY